MADSRAIGIFDSGLGGLTAVNALIKELPGESFIYVGDTARIPYGEKDVETIGSYAREIVSFLQEKDVKAIIVACGTVSSNVIEDLRSEFDVPLIDVIAPGLEAALRLCGDFKKKRKKRLGLIATEATVKSGLFQKILKEENPLLDLEVLACPLFVPLIEDGMAKHIVTDRIVEASLRCWQEKPLDVLILGCTHYPLLSAAIQKTLGETILVDLSVATIEFTSKFLREKGLLNDSGSGSGSGSGKISHEFYVSGDVEKFNEMAGKITSLSLSAHKIFWK